MRERGAIPCAVAESLGVAMHVCPLVLLRKIASTRTELTGHDKREWQEALQAASSEFCSMSHTQDKVGHEI